MTRTLMSALLVILGTTLWSAEGPVIVVNAASTVKDLTLQQMNDILAGERKEWDGGTRITLVLPREGSPEMAALLSKIYKMDAEGLKKHWTELVFQNKLTSPPRNASSRVAAKLVEEDSNAIAVIAGKDMTAGVKAVTIDGKGPDDAAYPLK